MTNKKLGRDVLEDVLTGDHDYPVPGLDELTKIIARHIKPKTSIKTRRTAHLKAQKNKQKEKEPLGDKKKTTYYLSADVFKELDEARYLIEKLLPEQDKSHISKSGIVNTALKMFLKELSKNGEDSILFKQIMKDHEKKE